MLKQPVKLILSHCKDSLRLVLVRKRLFDLFDERLCHTTIKPDQRDEMKRDICVLISLKRVLLNQNSEMITVASVIRTEIQMNGAVWCRQKHSG